MKAAQGIDPLTQATASPSDRRRATIGIAASTSIIVGLVALNILAIYLFPITLTTFVPALMVAAVLCWLFTGLFIVAHDAIHGSIAPGSPWINRLFGRLAMGLYAGFDYDRMAKAHHAHHAAPGSDTDPDFATKYPRSFWPWYGTFMKTYFGWRPFIFVNVIVLIHMVLFGASLTSLVLFYGAPAIGSSLQLFYFGTFLPHRRDVADRPFEDHHNARTTEAGWLASFFSCFHFGYHHEHHLYPHEPWWRLPARRTERAEKRVPSGVTA